MIELRIFRAPAKYEFRRLGNQTWRHQTSDTSISERLRHDRPTNGHDNLSRLPRAAYDAGGKINEVCASKNSKMSIPHSIS